MVARVTLLTIAILVSALSARASEKIAKETLVSQGRKHTYYLFVPAKIEPNDAFPMILLFHGSGRNGLSVVEKWADLAAKERIILVGPNAQDSQSWRTPEDGPDSLRELVETLKAKYPVDARRIYLFGHSAGAVFGLNLSMFESEYFAALAMHAGSWRDDQEFQVIEHAKRKTPIALFVGDRDAFFPLTSVKATNDALRARGFPIELTIIKGHDHWYYDLAPEINRMAWEFLKQHALTEDPKYEEFVSAEGVNEINKLIDEINELINKAEELARSFYTREEELKKKDDVRERESVLIIAREEISLLTRSETAHQEAALKAERAMKTNPAGMHGQYLSLIAQLERKRAEVLATMREYVELLLGDQPPNTVTIKRNEAVLKVERLQQEADELEQKVERLKPAKH